MVGHLFTTTFNCAVFRNTTCASLDQERIGLATGGAQTHWPPKTYLGLYDNKFVPFQEFTFMGDFRQLILSYGYGVQARLIFWSSGCAAVYTK